MTQRSLVRAMRKWLINDGIARSEVDAMSTEELAAAVDRRFPGGITYFTLYGV